MMLQLALDCFDEKKALSLIEQTQETIDIIEIGTPLIKYQGINLLKKIRKTFPNHKILVDLKTMDAGEYEATPFFDEGANFVTVLAASDTSTVMGVVKAAESHRAQVVIDLISVSDKVARIKELSGAKSHYFSIHTGIDQQLQGQNPLSDLSKVINACDVAISVAGGINLNTISQIAHFGPDIVVVGGAITGAENPAKMAKEIKKRMTQSILEEALKSE